MNVLTRLAVSAGSAGLLVMAGPAGAEVTGNVGFASNYVYRGVSQTWEKPALQGGFDYAHSSGLYAGIWASNVSWLEDAGTGASNSLEADLYGGYKGRLGGDAGYDFGILHYEYPGSYPAGSTQPHTDELYVAASYLFLTAKYSYSAGNLFGYNDSRGSGYLDVGASFELPGKTALGLHVGHQTIRHNSAFNYTDYRLGVSKEINGFVACLAYAGTNANDALYTVKGRNIADGQWVLSVSRTF